jgi:uncharacterized membrane protein YidH (DUF202 family)
LVNQLANERTFLAWLRTSLAFASIGVAITQFFRLSTSDSNGKSSIMMVGSSTNPSELKRLSAVLGGLFVGMGMVIMLFGLIRYFTTQHYLLSDKFPVARATVFLAFVATFSVSLAHYDVVNLTNQLVVITFGILIRVTT